MFVFIIKLNGVHLYWMLMGGAKTMEMCHSIVATRGNNDMGVNATSGRSWFITQG
jgi:hypothetical protein